MGQLLLPRKKEIKGPWLLNIEDFEKLNDIIENIGRLLQDSVEEEMKQEVLSEDKFKNLSSEEVENEIINRKGRYSYKSRVDQITVVSDDGTTLKDTRVNNLLKSGALHNLKPVEFSVDLFQGIDNSFALRISHKYDGELSYNIKCFDSEISDDIKYQIDRWVEERKPRKVLQLWSHYGGFINYCLFVAFLMLAAYAVSESYTTYDDVLVQESHTLLNKGINSSNRDKAIELLLKAESGYVPESFTPSEIQTDSDYPKFLFISGFFLLISIIRPHTTIGLGKKKESYTFYMIWTKLVIVTIPLAVIVAPFWQAITDWLF